MFENRCNPDCSCCHPPGYVPPITVSIPGCLCQKTPASLSLVATYGPGETSATYANAYQSCTLGYYTQAPGYMPQSAFSGPGYYSDAAWVDDHGFTDYFRLNCFSTQYALGFGQDNQGIWQSPGQIYNWSLGGSPAVNTCGSPTMPGTSFALNVGRAQSGVFFNGKFVVTG